MATNQFGQAIGVSPNTSAQNLQKISVIDGSCKDFGPPTTESEAILQQTGNVIKMVQ